MKDDKNKPTPLHERLHGDAKNEEKETTPEVKEVIKSGQAGNPKYANMNNENDSKS